MTTMRALLLALANIGTTIMPQPRAAEPMQELSMDGPFISEILTFLVRDQVMGTTTCSTLFVGSSSIRFWFTLEDDFPDRQVVGRGFGGAHLEHVISYFDLLITPHQPKQMVVYAGENDLSAGKPVEQVIADLQQLLDIKTDRLGTTPVYYIAAKPSTLRFAEFETQSKFNAKVRGLADTRDDLIYIDIVAPMMQDGAPKDIFIADNLHMTLDGYALWVPAVKAALSESASTAAHCN